MFKKLNYKILLIAVVILATIIVIINLKEGEDRTFRSKVLNIEPDAITELRIYDPQSQEEITLIKNGEDAWTLMVGDNEYIGDKGAIKNVLNMMNNMQTESIITRNENKYEEFEVSEETGIKVKIFQDGDMTDELIIGKFTYQIDEQIKSNSRVSNQQNTKLTSYVRPVEEKNVYAINGFLKMNFTNAKAIFRMKNIMEQNHESYRKLAYNYPGKEYILEKHDIKWMLNNQPVDSAATEKYIRSLAMLRNSSFIDTVDISGIKPTHKLKVEGTGFTPVIVEAYPSQDTTIGYYITSTINPGSIWNGSTGKLFEKIFKSEEYFFDYQ